MNNDHSPAASRPGMHDSPLSEKDAREGEAAASGKDAREGEAAASGEDAREGEAAGTSDHSAEFIREDRSISLLQANFQMVFVAVPAVLLFAIPYALIWDAADLFALSRSALGVLVIAILAGIVVHEAIHGITWKLATGKPFGVIRFGFDWKTVTPYAHCREPMRADAYRLGAGMPLLLMGVLPSIAGIATGSAAVMAFGLFFTFAAGGDMLILWLLRDVRGTELVEDHPSRAGSYVLRRNEDERRGAVRSEEER